MSKIKYISVCSGIEAASVAWHSLDWEPLAFSEIEPFPCAVLAHHWPHVPNHGDMTKFMEWPNLHEADLLVGGTPCQAFSVAGLRNSLSDDRGNLTLTYVKILNQIDEKRNHAGRPAAICVWENVPGVLNTKDNAFGCFLGALAGSGGALQPPSTERGWTNAGCVYGPQRAVAWRVLDAQYFGVAQRRRRVFVVASARDGFDPSQILFEFEGMRRDFAPSREARKDTACGAGAGFTASSFGQYEHGVGTLRSAGGDLGGGSETLAVTTFPLDSQNWGEGHNSGGKGFGESADPSFTITKGRSHAVATVVAIQDGRGLDKAQNGKGFSEDDVAYTVDTHATQAVAARMVAFGEYACDETASTMKMRDHKDATDLVVTTQGADLYNGAVTGEVACTLTRKMDVSGTTSGPTVITQYGEVAGSLTARHDSSPCADRGQNVIAAQTVAFAQNTRDEVREMPIVGALAAQPGMKQTSHIRQSYAVRRLTPTECERLQGFPDSHTKIPWRGKPAEECPDGPRYKACGNSMAVPCMKWIGERIQSILNQQPSTKPTTKPTV